MGLKMASPGALVTTVARALALPEVNVGSYYRALREDKGKLVSKSGRGTSAAEVTYLDAARLLIAIMGSTLVKDAPATVRMFGQFTSTIAPKDEGWHETTGYLPELPRQKCYEDALAYLLSRTTINLFDPDMIGDRYIDTRLYWMAKIEVNQLVGTLGFINGEVRYVDENDDRYVGPGSGAGNDSSDRWLRRPPSVPFRQLLADKFDGLGTIRYIRWPALETIGALVGGHDPVPAPFNSPSPLKGWNPD